MPSFTSAIINIIATRITIRSKHMKHGYYDSKPQLKSRLNRASGQIGGIAKMIEDDKYCIDILTQISAVRSALDKVALELISDHTRHCMNETDPSQKDAKSAELTTAIGRMMKLK